jgi:hypothetical protein
LNSKIYNKGLHIAVEKVNNKGIPCPPDQIEYVYPPKELLDSHELLLWRDHQLRELPKAVNDKELNLSYTIKYWKVTDRYIYRIARNKKWFQNIVATLESGYKKLLYYQKGDNYRKLLQSDKHYPKGETLDMTCILDSDTESDSVSIASDTESEDNF